MTGTQATPATGDCFENAALEDNLRAFERTLLRTKAPSTAESYVRYVRRLANLLGKDPMEWAPEDVDALMETEEWNEGWKAEATKALIRSAVKLYWRKTRRDLIEDPRTCDFWDTPRREFDEDAYRKMMGDVPGWDEVTAMLREVEDIIRTSKDPVTIYKHFPAWLAATYALRRSEVAHLRVRDVDLVAREVTILKSKGGKTRVVAMDPDDVTPALFERFMSARSSIIEGLLANLDDAEGHVFAKLTSLRDRADTPLFFSRKVGAADELGDDLKPPSVGHMIGAAASRIIGRKVKPHSLRHAKATRLVIDEKMPLPLAAQYLGHDDIQMTMKYVHSTTDDQREFFSNGAPASAPAAPSGDKAGTIAVLAALNKSGQLSDSAFAAAVAAL